MIAGVRELVQEFHGHVMDDAELGLDSLTTVLIVTGLEDRLGVKVPVQSVTPENFATIASIAALVALHAPGPT